jgi:hypothetical protein
MSIVTSSLMGIIFGSAIVYILSRMVAANRRIACLEQHVTKKADEEVVDGLTAKVASVELATSKVLSGLSARLDDVIHTPQPVPQVPEPRLMPHVPEERLMPQVPEPRTLPQVPEPRTLPQETPEGGEPQQAVCELAEEPQEGAVCDVAEEPQEGAVCEVAEEPQEGAVCDVAEEPQEIEPKVAEGESTKPKRGRRKRA